MVSIVLNSVLNGKVLAGAFNQEKVLVGAFSVIVKPMDRFTALLEAQTIRDQLSPRVQGDNT